VQVELSSQVLDEQAMVTDFEHVSETIGAWIRKELDHKMLLWEKDPAAALLIKAGEHVVLLKEHPTAEVLARLIFKEAQLLRLPVSRVIFWETVNSCASYHE
jgi:6-pyruvoyltetrahydropterin/6-carboxytetrahydropterin synthase